jgi:hypothetical protein
MNHTTTYTRVIPRDFFNEAKLLKCMGQLALKILDRQLPDGIDIVIEESGEPFNIELSEDGALFISNYGITINNNPAFIGSTYNSKAPYPLFVCVDYEETQVFDDSGNFTTDFINRFSNY